MIGRRARYLALAGWTAWLVIWLCGAARADSLRISLSFSTGDYVPVGPVYVAPVAVVPVFPACPEPASWRAPRWEPRYMVYPPRHHVAVGWYDGAFSLGWTFARPHSRHYGHDGLPQLRPWYPHRSPGFRPQPTLRIGFSLWDFDP